MNLISLSSLFFLYFFSFSMVFKFSHLYFFYSYLELFLYTLLNFFFFQCLIFYFPSPTWLHQYSFSLLSLPHSLFLVSLTKTIKMLCFFTQKKKSCNPFFFLFFFFLFFVKRFRRSIHLIIISDPNNSINCKKEGLRFLKLDQGQIKVEP